ncbi:hypothetical protein H0I76_11790 [Limibaculum sp. M0105]|uniref:Uncharacterized protein n=1 Tax=Thermohalobaculum xanthum TaxID=2753746 RepID=A0A8J7M7A3_9RHOB|nr:hypothetical protein [Thermohalobaculum xanthum]MBK0399874.1 hypothetical protein [Thermohalobaculum xanthum]
MIELVFVACLLSAPDRCEEKALQFVDVSHMACLMGAQPQLAEWTESHPKWRIARWSCRIPGAKQRI